MIRFSGLVNAVHRFLGMSRKEIRSAATGVQDGRKRRGRRWHACDLLGNGVQGKLAGLTSLRAVETLTEVARGGSTGTYGGRRMPDNTLHGMLEVSGEETMGGFLARLTRSWHRGKKLEPVHGQRIGGAIPHVLIYDGKQSVTSEVEQPAPYFKKSTSKTSVVDGKKVTEKVTYWAADFVRCVLGSAAAGVCIGLRTVVNRDEVRAVKDLHAEMLVQHRWLRTDAVLVLADAKHGNKEFVKQLGDPYPEPGMPGRRPGAQYCLLKIKGNAGAIYKGGLRAIRRKANVEPPEAVTDFENAGHGRRTHRELYRVETNLAYGADQDEA